MHAKCDQLLWPHAGKSIVTVMSITLQRVEVYHGGSGVEAQVGKCMSSHRRCLATSRVWHNLCWLMPCAAPLSALGQQLSGLLSL